MKVSFENVPWVVTFATEESKKLRLPSFLPNLSFFKRYDCGSPHHGIIDYDRNSEMAVFIRNMKL